MKIPSSPVLDPAKNPQLDSLVLWRCVGCGAMGNNQPCSGACAFRKLVRRQRRRIRGFARKPFRDRGRGGKTGSDRWKNRRPHATCRITSSMLTPGCNNSPANVCDQPATMKHSGGSRLIPNSRPRLSGFARRADRSRRRNPASAFASAATANSCALTIMSNWPRKSKQCNGGRAISLRWCGNWLGSRRIPVSVKKHAALFRKRRSSCLIALPPSRSRRQNPY